MTIWWALMEHNDEILRLCTRLKLGTAIPDLLELFDDKEKAVIEKALAETEKQRISASFARNLKRAGLDSRKTFASYEFGAFKWPLMLPKEDFTTCRFIDRAENVILFGAPGTGKSHLATAAGIEACRQKRNVEFHTTTAFVARLSAAFQSGKTGELFERLNRLDLLILDEWGYVPIDPVGAQLLFRVIGDFYERKSIILTTNLVFSEWANIFHDQKLTAAILDRMVHHSHFIQFEGESYRIAHSLMA